MKKISLLVVVLLLSACSKLTLTNYDSLELGMSVEEIEQIIGSVDECSETLGTRACYWGDKEGTYIKVTFVAGSAVAFSNQGIK